jgi:two-component system, cell cycle sensor histidine kinase and response regulator CckA
VTDVNDAISHAAQLTASLLTYAKREAVAPATLRPDELTRRVLPMLKAMAGTHVHLSCELNAPGALVTIDPTQFRQVLLNLVGNAGEAVREHGNAVRLSSRLAVLDYAQVRAHGLSAAGGFYVISVADDGPGISADVLEHIFDPFFTTKQHGTGLGLATSYSVVHRAGGFIEVRSLPLEGATFDVYLPAAEAAPAPP